MTESTFWSGSVKWQYISAISANTGAIGLGTVLGYTSPALPSLKEDKTFSFLQDSTTSASFISSIIPLGALCSCLITGFLIGRFGRKTTMLFVSPTFIGGWILIGFAQNYAMLLAGRFLTGFSGGAFSLASPVYIAETAEPKLRGMLGSGFQLGIVTGILFVYAFGSFLKWNHLAFVCAIIPIDFAICMFFMPESPRFYVIKNKISLASASLQKLRGADSHSQIAPELEAIKLSVEEACRNQGTFTELFHPSILKPTSLSLALMFFQQFSGINAVIFFMTDIFIAAQSTLSGSLSSIIVGIVQFIATALSTILVDRTGRKILLTISDAVMAISLVALGIYFYFKEAGNSVYEQIGWLPLLSLVVFITAISLGYGPIPWLMVGEILPPRALGPASTVATVFNWFLGFLVTQFFGTIRDGIGTAWSFWIFAIVCAVGTVFVICFLPETKGKSLDEIQALFESSATKSSSFGQLNGDGKKTNIQESRASTSPTVP